MALKIKKQEMKTFQWESGENMFQLNIVDGEPTMLKMKLEGHGALIIYDADSIKMIKEFFTVMDMAGEE